MYPYLLQNKDIEIFPIFWEQKKDAVFLSMDDEDTFMKSLSDDEIRNQVIFDKKIYEFSQKTSNDLIISWFLEKRKRMFEALDCPQMVLEKRFYHLWLDITTAKGTKIYAPLAWKVYEVAYEEWYGNNGWYIILEHTVWKETFYSLYAHQSFENIPIKSGDIVKAGDQIWVLGDYSENGGYFHHLHLQIVTELWKQEWFFHKWYCTAERIPTIDRYTPNPTFLFQF